MDDRSPEEKDNAATELETEIRRTRKFSATEAIARIAGPGSLKGASPVSRLIQAETEIGCWLSEHLTDSGGVLKMLLQRQLKGSQLLLENLDQPLVALAVLSSRVVASDCLLTELVREADVEWGRRMDERPRFDRPGSSPDANDPYTAVSVTEALIEIQRKLEEGSG